MLSLLLSFILSFLQPTPVAQDLGPQAEDVQLFLAAEQPVSIPCLWDTPCDVSDSPAADTWGRIQRLYLD